MEQILKKYEINDQYKNILMFDKGEEVEDEKEYEKNINNKFLNNKRSFSPESLNNDIIDSNFTLSNNNISQLSDLDENDESVDHSYIESSKLNNYFRTYFNKNFILSINRRSHYLNTNLIRYIQKSYVSLKDCITTGPGRSCDIVSYKNFLIVHTCHHMYDTGDG